eukprot:7829584-Pyramimonas_sp.AAC.1
MTPKAVNCRSQDSRKRKTRTMGAKETIALPKSQRQRRESGRDRGRERGTMTDTYNMHKSEIPDRSS